jgi:hypothetical protein
MLRELEILVLPWLYFLHDIEFHSAVMAVFALPFGGPRINPATAASH